ncbi:hypothetical protein IIK97_004080 [Salmonella enterica subsp. enterica serovar Nigeria]|nr:hypothetical protein [Salmonella enterica subsp. enterica serovar Nigeria]
MKNTTREKVRKLQEQGFTQQKTAQEIGMSMGTVRRYWNSAGAENSDIAAQILIAQQSGFTQSQTARIYKISVTTVKHYWLTAERRGRPSHEVEIRHLIEEGKGNADIVRKLGIHRSTVERWRKRLEIEQ